LKGGIKMGDEEILKIRRGLLPNPDIDFRSTHAETHLEIPGDVHYGIAWNGLHDFSQFLEVLNHPGTHN